jgi:hypothetical protein
MQRPVMNTMGSGESLPRRRFLPSLARRFLSNALRRRPAERLVIEEGSRRGRIIRAILYRLSLMPALAMLVASALVYVRTHPQPLSPYALDPLTQGVYYEPINLLAEDGVRLEAWLAPALDARDVLAAGAETLRQRWPAVVLVPGFGMSREQVLPLIEPLHDKGFVVLALGPRGSGGTGAGQTFGLNEALDVRAAVNLLRRRPFVDGREIAVVGFGSGANAALLADDRDPALAAMVLDAPEETGDEALNRYIAAGSRPATWLLPLCRLAFIIGYDQDLHDLDLPQYSRDMAARPTLLLRAPADAQEDVSPLRAIQITEFLEQSMANAEPPASVDAGQ